MHARPNGQPALSTTVVNPGVYDFSGLPLHPDVLEKRPARRRRIPRGLLTEDTQSVGRRLRVLPALRLR